uniref:Uncharacterized protein n=1 Tax=Nelumbo nucifera TaxID=4432 RepID=A0A822ZG79_NELNU|nr:TPA_asm: hypothetical protein HUJ06_002116 [Nelumbo nucifera]
MGFGHIIGVGVAISSHMDIDKVSFTVGRLIMQAGATNNLKVVSL